MCPGENVTLASGDSQEDIIPGVVVAIAPRPRATLCNPFGIKIRSFLILQSLKALD